MKFIFLIIVLVLYCTTSYGFTWTSPVHDVNVILANSDQIIGTNEQEIGYLVFSGLDVTGDGKNDILVQADYDSVLINGAITQKIFFLDNKIDGTNSYIIEGRSYNTARIMLCQDINGDNIGEILSIGSMWTNELNEAILPLQVTLGGSYHLPFMSTYDHTLPLGFLMTTQTNISISAGGPLSDADINADGTNDIITTMYVRYGAAQTNDTWNVAHINGTNGFILKYGRYEASTGDYNGDGRIDSAITSLSGLSLLWSRKRFGQIINITNLPPEDGMVIKNASIGKNGGFGDINGDGIDDIIMPGGIVMFGRTNWGTNPDAATMGLGEIMYPTSSVANVYFGGFYRGGKTAVIGDLNGDGFDDWAIAAIQEIQIHPPIQSNKFLVVYGKPIYPVNMEMWLLNSTNGFAIVNLWILSHTRGGDWDSDGYEEAIFGMPWEADHKGIVTITPGGPSPAWSPYIFTPELIMEGRSNAVASTVLTNMVTGRKGKRHMVLSDGPEPIEQECLGTWFTTKVIRTLIDETRTVNYWTTNILGRSNPATTLVINAVPEPGMIMAAMIIAIGIMTVRKNGS